MATKAKEKVENTQDVTQAEEKPVEFHGEIADMAYQYLGSKVNFEMKALNGYEVEAKKLLPKIKCLGLKFKKPATKYKIKIQGELDGEYRQYIVTKGKKIVYTKETEKKKEYTKAIEDLFATIVSDITEAIATYHTDCHQMIANQFCALYNEGKIEGSYESIPEAAYHLCVGVSKSMLSFILSKTYAHLEHNQNVEKKETPSLRFGKAFHSKTLTPKLAKKEVAVEPEFGLKKEEKIAKKLFAMENADKVIISAKENELIDRMSEKLSSHPVASVLIKEALTEVSLFWKNELGGLSRGRLDGIIANPSQKLQKILTKYLPGYRGQSIFFDVKTCEDAKESEFSKKMFNYGYYIQKAYYRKALDTLFPNNEWLPLLIAVEKTGPNEVACYPLNDATLELGEQHYLEALNEYTTHKNNPDMWHGYSLKMSYLSVPHWAFKSY